MLPSNVSCLIHNGAWRKVEVAFDRPKGESFPLT
jgi:hypothetical protein